MCLPLGIRYSIGSGAVLFRDHQDAPLGLVVLAELDATVGLADDCEILGLARLEQLGHPRQTAGDVARLRGFPRDAGEHVAGLDLRAVVHREDRVDRHEVARLDAVGEREGPAIGVAQRDARLQVVAARLLLPVDDHLGGDAGRLVEHLAHRSALDQVDVVGDAVPLGDDRDRVGIPFRQLLALGHHGPVIGDQLGAIGHAVACLLAAGLVDQHQFAIAAHDDRHARRVDDHELRFLTSDLASKAASTEIARRRAGPRRRYGRSAWSAACPARRSTAPR